MIDRSKLKKELDDLTKLFKKYGDPSLNPDIYGDKLNTCQLLYRYYTYNDGDLETTYLAVVYPRIKARYNGDINNLIKIIESDPDFDKKDIIFIPNDICNLNHLNILKEKYKDKEIIIKWNDSEIAYIDDVIAAEYMIDYYKSVISDELSPLEKITMAYDITKSHYYKEYEIKHTLKSRDLTKMVYNNNIVCAGFANIFNRILTELGFISYKFNCQAGIDDKTSYHARNIIKIDDEKYDISGLYIFDATFDSADKEFYYTKDGSYFGKEKKKDTKKLDTLSNYKFFLIKPKYYEERFKGWNKEKLSVSFENDNIAKIIHHLLHDNQEKVSENTYTDMPCKDFIKLIYNVKLKEGYDRSLIPMLVQESLFTAGYGFIDKNLINNYISVIIENNIDNYKKAI